MTDYDKNQQNLAYIPVRPSNEVYTTNWVKLVLLDLQVSQVQSNPGR